MTAIERVSAVPLPQLLRAWILGNWGLLLAIAALLAVLLLPTPAGLPVAGHRTLAILAFAVIIRFEAWPPNILMAMA